MAILIPNRLNGTADENFLTNRRRLRADWMEKRRQMRSGSHLCINKLLQHGRVLIQLALSPEEPCRVKIGWLIRSWCRGYESCVTLQHVAQKPSEGCPQLVLVAITPPS